MPLCKLGPMTVQNEHETNYFEKPRLHFINRITYCKTYLSGSVLRSAFRRRQFALSTLPAIGADVVAALRTGVHHSRASDGGVDIVVVRTRRAGRLQVLHVMRALWRVYLGKEVFAKRC